MAQVVFMGGEIIRRGPKRVHKMDPETTEQRKQRLIRKGNRKRSRPEAFVLNMRGWEALGAKQFQAGSRNAPEFLTAGELKTSSMLVKLGEAVREKKTGRSALEMGPDAGKKALVALNRFGKQEMCQERLEALVNGRGMPTIEELGSIYLAMRGSRNIDAQCCMFRILQGAVKHGNRRMRVAADQCMDTLLEQGITDYRKMQ